MFPWLFPTPSQLFTISSKLNALILSIIYHHTIYQYHASVSLASLLHLSELWAPMDVLLDTEDLHGINTNNTNSMMVQPMHPKKNKNDCKNRGSTSSTKCWKNMVVRNHMFTLPEYSSPSSASVLVDKHFSADLSRGRTAKSSKKFMSVTTQQFHCEQTCHCHHQLPQIPSKSQDAPFNLILLWLPLPFPKKSALLREGTRGS